jgi:hypothetical protein
MASSALIVLPFNAANLDFANGLLAGTPPAVHKS